MTVVLGTNAGFVLTAPTADPTGGSSVSSDGFARATKDTSPAGDFTITEMGFWLDSTGGGEQTGSIQMGLYSDAGAGEPEARLQVVIDITKPGAGGVWVVASGLSWTLSASTAYWLAVQIDSHGGSSVIDRELNTGSGRANLASATELPADWGTSSSSDADDVLAIYALVEEAGGGIFDDSTELVLPQVRPISSEPEATVTIFSEFRRAA